MEKSKNIRSNAITEGVIWKQLLLFFYPLLIGTFFETLYSTVDAVVVGQYAGKLALSAVGGSALILINLIIGFFIGLSSGSSVIISQRYGAKDEDGVAKSVHTAMAIALIGGAVVTVLCLFVAPNFLEIMKTPPEILDLSRQYLTIYSLGSISLMVFNMASGILRAIGDSRTPTLVLIISCIINIVLDILFVKYFEWNVAGAAFATIIAQTVSAVILIVILMRKTGPERLILSKIRLYPGFIKSILYIGIPSGIRSIMYSLSNIFIQVGINELGTDSVAAWAAYAKIDLLYWMVINSLGTSLTTFIGQNYGAGKYERIKKGTREACLMMIAATILYNLLTPFTPTLLRMFTEDAEVIRIAVDVCRFMFPSYFLFITIELFSCVLIGIGDSIPPTFMTIIGVCGLRMAWLGFILPRWHVMESVLVSYPLSWGITSIAFLIYYFVKVRRKVLTKREPVKYDHELI